MTHLTMKPWVTHEDEEAVAAQLALGFLNDGKRVDELEDKIGQYHQAYCVVLPNCTLALVLLCQYYGSKTAIKNVVAIPELSMISTATAPISTGRKIRLVQTDSRGLMMFSIKDMLNLSVNYNGRLSPFIDNNRITDSAQSILTKGIATTALATAISLGALKNVTCGIGGGILTTDSDLYTYLKELKNYGRKRGSEEFGHVGGNFKVSDLNAALAISQWERRDEISERKWAIYYRYKDLLGNRVVENDLSKGEVPWLAEVRVSKKYYEHTDFRKVYAPFHTEKILQPYIESGSNICEPAYRIFMPSWSDISYTEIRKYAEQVLKEDKDYA